MQRKQKIIIVGAGIAGLTLSCRLSASGHDVLVVEREGTAGGLARSYSYDDGYVFDPGPHRFYSENPSVVSFIEEVLGNDQLRILRNSGVRMFGRYFSWPLTAGAILRMPPSVLVAVASDVLRRQGVQGPSFEDYIIGRYGRTLYAIFFKPYTEKFLGLPCSEISKDWAVTGIDRAVIDSTVHVEDLLALAKSLIAPRAPLEFIYPKSGGIGVFPERLVRRTREQGGRVLLNAEITAIRREGAAVRSVVVGREEHDCDLLVWTGSVTDAAALFGSARSGLRYLSLVIYNYCLGAAPRCPYQWCYFGAADVPFNRITIPTTFNAALAPPGRSGVCVEVTCRQGDGLWNDPERTEARIRRALRDNEVIGSERDIDACHIERLSNAYPVYTLDYAGQYARAKEELLRVRNLRLLGRTGTFWYNNMDHSIEAALRMHQEIVNACPGASA